MMVKSLEIILLNKSAALRESFSSISAVVWISVSLGAVRTADVISFFSRDSFSEFVRGISDFDDCLSQFVSDSIILC